MKSFFKKLAFVMALAMVVSLAAPAAKTVAFAAEGLKVAYQNAGVVTELNMKAGAKEDLRFLGAPANWKEVGFKWTSSNEAVATVDQAGWVTAVADGTAIITITVGDLTGSVKVTVGEVIYNVTLGTADNKAMTTAELKVGESLNLDFFGVKDWNGGKNYSCTWIPSDTDVVKVDKEGVVTALAAGTADVTLAIVNTVTKATHSVTPVTFTVKAVEDNSFEVVQVSTDDIKLVFDTARVVAAEDVKVNMKYNGVDIEIPVDKVTVNGNTVAVALYSELENEAEYTVTYKDVVETFTASVGDVASVAFNYTSVDLNKPDKLIYPGVAYVSTDDEPVTVFLSPVLYDAKGIDVTKAYDLNEFEISYEVAVESENYDLVDNELTFEKASTATVKLIVEWYDEEGELHSKPYAAAIRATKRPALQVTYVDGGFIQTDNATKLYDFTRNPWGYYWCTGSYNNTYTLDGTNANIQFAAKFTDNRATTNVTGSNYSAGNFVFRSSNENLFTIDEVTGVITPDGSKTGTASVLVYFVNANDESNKEVFIGSTKITIRAERYPAKYVISETSKTTVNAGDYTADKFVMEVYDQYNSKIDLTNGVSDITVEATSDSNPVLTDIVRDGIGKYFIKFDGKNFDGLLNNHSYATFKYKVSVDKEENVKVSTGVTSLSLKVYDVDTYYTQLENFLDDDTTNDDNTPAKFYYDVAVDKSSVDVAVRQFSEFAGNASDFAKAVQKATDINIYYENSSGYRLEKVPAANIEERLNGQTTGDAGKIYYKFEAPSRSAKNYQFLEPDTDGKLGFLFNDSSANGFSVDDDENRTYATTDFYATTGSYKVTLYTTKSVTNDTLVKMGDYVINVTNSTPIKGAITASVNSTVTDVNLAGLTDATKNAAALSILNNPDNVYFSYNYNSAYYNNFYNWYTSLSIGEQLVKGIQSVDCTVLSNGKLKIKSAVVEYKVVGTSVTLRTTVNINKTFTNED